MKCECQSVVADVVGRVVGFGHRPDGECRDDILFGLALDAPEELVHLLGDGTPLGGLEDMAEAEDELPEVLQLVDVRFVVDAIDHRAVRLAAPHLPAELRDAAVGQQHELFDQLVRLLLFLEIDAQRLAVFIEFELRLGTVEADGSAPEPFAPHGLRQPVERQYLLGEVAAAGFDHLLRLLIGEAAVGIDYRAAEPLVVELELLVENEDRREAETLFVGPQRAKFVAEPFGQHRHRAIDQIDRCAAGFGFGIDDRARTHIVRDIGDVNADLPQSLSGLADRQRIVEILGIGRIDRKGRHGAEVAPFGIVLLRDCLRNGVGGRLDLRFKTVGEIVFGQYGMHLGVVLARLAQHIDQFADRTL